MENEIFGFVVCIFGFIALSAACWLLGKILSFFTDRIL